MKKNWDLLPKIWQYQKFKLFLYMKLSMILLLVGSLHLSANSFSQAKVSLSMKDATVQEVFSSLEKMTNYTFLYKMDLVGKCGRVNVEVVDKDFSQLLDELLRPLGLSFKIDDQVVVITVVRVDDQKKEMMIIKGTVKDKKGELLPGVTIVLKGTRVGVASGINGQFVMSTLKQDSVTLVFSFVGMKTKEVKWKGQATLNVVLEEDTKVMDEVVVSTGYQSVNRRDMVGSYTTVKASDIMMPIYTSIDQMLQGQVAGMIVMNTSSRVGTSPKIKIRGTSTILGNQSPIWVVDGIIQEDPIELNVSSYMTNDLKTIIGNQISWLNPMDIETITVLKDASATAVYGSKASNGVIVITTKKGKVDRLTINYSGSMSVNTKPNYGQFNYMNSQERIVFSQEAFNAGAIYNTEPIMQPYTYEGAMQMYLNGEMSSDDFAKRRGYLESVNTDWFDLLTQSAISHNHNVSVSGGSEKITYNVSAGYSNSEGQEIGNSSEKLTGRLSVDVRLHKNVRLNVSMNGNTGTNKGFGEGVNPMGYATTTSRAIPAYDEQGDPLFYQLWTEYVYNKNVRSLSYNFINERDNSGAQVENTHFSGALNFSWDITDWLKYEFTGGYSRDHTNSESWNLEKTFLIAREYRGYDYNAVEPGSAEFKAAKMPFGGKLLTSDGMQSSFNIQNKLLVSKSFNEDHRLNVMLAMELRSSATKNNSNIAYGYVPGRGEIIIRPTYPEDIVPITGSVSKDWGMFEDLYAGKWNRTKKTDNYLSFFATLAYSLKNRYVFNFSVRNDASNRFGQDVNRRLDPTYSFGLSWRVMEEPFFADQTLWVSALNFRATYGIQGNALTRLGPDLSLIQQGVQPVYNQYTSAIRSIPNPNLSWERTKTLDLGVDFELFKIFSLTFDYYLRNSNAIISRDIAYEYGQPTMELNGGKLRNSGLEFTVSFTPVQRKDWALSVSLNSSKNWNSARNQQYKATRDDLLGGRSDRILKKGYPISGFWSYSFSGLSPEDGRPLFNYLDVPAEERDPKVDPSSFLVYSGTTEPAFTGGMNLSLRYKTFSLSSSFSLLLGGKKRLTSPYSRFNYGTYIPDVPDNLNKDLNKRWKKSGDEANTSIPGFVTSFLNEYDLPNGSTMNWMEMWAKSDELVVDASFFRCRQITLSWNMTPDWCQKIGFKSLGLTATVNNIFVIASKRFHGFDPELGDSVQPKNYSVGINVGF